MKTIVIAEAGVNHNGDIELAKKLVDSAAFAGADFVKFQTFKAEKLVTVGAVKANYQKENTNKSDESQLEMLRKLELTFDEFILLSQYCEERNIGFLSSPFDLETIEFLAPLIPFYKIPSGEITNYPYLKKIASMGKPIVLSTGMCINEDIKNALEVLMQNGLSKNDISILHCNTEYPTPMKDVNLNAMLSIKEMFEVNVGYSDHTIGIEVPIAAVALGARIIEKHFTLDKNMKGPDHKASLNPTELTNMIKSIRNIEIALGTGVKQPSESEFKNIIIARKSIVAAKKIYRGEVFDNGNITAKRPGTGITPMKWEQVIGKVATRDYDLDELIEETL
jgi:N,N'-diacetyllegionaminate synthase